jgi:hypothetical protein
MNPPSGPLLYQGEKKIPILEFVYHMSIQNLLSLKAEVLSAHWQSCFIIWLNILVNSSKYYIVAVGTVFLGMH